jgi:hypothetical protein
MSKTTIEEKMAALADVAKGVSRFRELTRDNLDLSNTMVAEVFKAAGTLVASIMYVGPDPVNPDAPDLAPNPPAPRKKPGRKPKTAQVEKAGKPAFSNLPEAEAPAPKKMMGVCVDCGTSYLKTSNVQKRCPGCGADRKAAAVASVSAGADRLSRIKAIDKNLDTIPEA